MIKSLFAKNFAGLTDQPLEFGQVNKIVGMNGTGKTSVGNALRYAITGLSQDLTAAGAAYMKDPAQPMEVRLEIGPNVLVRRRTKSSGSSSVDGKPTTDVELSKLVGMPLFVYATMVWPESFFRLDVAKRRELFMTITPEVSVAELFKARTGLMLPDEDWRKPIKKLHDEQTQIRLAATNELARIQGQIDELKVNVCNNSSFDISRLTEERATAQKKYQEACAKAEEFEREDQRYQRAVQEHAQWHARQEANEKAIQENRLRDERRAKLVSVEEIADLLNPLVVEAKTTQFEIDRLVTDGQAARAELEKIRNAPTTCSMCGRELDNQQVDTSALEQKIADLRSANKEKSADLRRIDDRIAELKTNQENANKHNAALGPLDHLPVFPETPTPSVPEFDRTAIVETRQEMNACAEEVGKLTSMIASINQSKAAQEKAVLKLKNLEQSAQQFTTTIERARMFEAALHPKTGVGSEALKQKLSAVTIPGFRFEFSETLSNGEERDAFNIVREEDGVPVEHLSSGQRIKFCIELSKLIATIANPNPEMRFIFIQHADLLDTVKAPAGFQIFAERVTKTDFGIEIVR
jgi:DNA repair exonuclease SbcCD ATPase subunit